MEGEEARRRESVTVKDEQISLLKAVVYNKLDSALNIS